jgi:Trypsin-like peptidase domain
VGLEERRVVRTSVPLDAGGDLYCLGSGYLIADGLVLTAAHVLERTEGVPGQEGEVAEVACIGGGWRPATVAWVDAGRDVAVLSCPGLQAAGEVRWGRLAGSDPLDWGAVGFPVASIDEVAGRQAEHAFGRTSPISERSAGRLALSVESREATGGDSPWAGLSGAAVFCGDHLVGVVLTDPGKYAKSLVGRRVEDFCHDPGLARLLGHPPALEDIEGTVREPGLPDLRSTLRSPNRSFTGRERDLAALAAQPQGRTVLTQSLVGLGGVGKSALALEYAHRRYDAGEVDLAWWFVAEDRSVLLASMARLYGRLTGTLGGGEDAEAGAAALRNWLERSPYRWVVVFDNAEPGTLDGILPEEGTGQVIITSRASDWRDTGTTHMVGRLPPDQAVALLGKITALPADDAAWQLTEELGGLALAIEQAAAYMRQTHTGYRDYLDALRRDPRAVYDADLAQSESVAARVWRRSLDHVTGGQDDHPAAVILGVMSYLAPDDIPRQLFNPDAIQTVPLVDALGVTKLTVALGELGAYSLITIDTDSINVHRVIQQLTRLDADTRGLAVDYCGAAIGLLDACV